MVKYHSTISLQMSAWVKCFGCDSVWMLIRCVWDIFLFCMCFVSVVHTPHTNDFTDTWDMLSRTEAVNYYKLKETETPATTIPITYSAKFWACWYCKFLTHYSSFYMLWMARISPQVSQGSYTEICLIKVFPSK
jgi:hypothetical protein